LIVDRLAPGAATQSAAPVSRLSPPPSADQLKLRFIDVVLGQPFDVPQRLVNLILDIRIAIWGPAGVQVHLDPWTVL
jgi:hypothetical protein